MGTIFNSKISMIVILLCKICKGCLINNYTIIMTLANEVAFGVRYLVGYINRFKIQRLKKWYLLPLCPILDNKSDSRGECLGPEKGEFHTLYSGSHQASYSFNVSLSFSLVYLMDVFSPCLWSMCSGNFAYI